MGAARVAANAIRAAGDNGERPKCATTQRGPPQQSARIPDRRGTGIGAAIFLRSDQRRVSARTG
jgi:hypothetical protein